MSFSIPDLSMCFFPSVLLSLCISSLHSFFLYRYPFPCLVPHYFCSLNHFFLVYFFIEFFPSIYLSFPIPYSCFYFMISVLLSLCTSSSHSYFLYIIPFPCLTCFPFCSFSPSCLMYFFISFFLYIQVSFPIP